MDDLDVAFVFQFRSIDRVQKNVRADFKFRRLKAERIRLPGPARVVRKDHHQYPDAVVQPFDSRRSLAPAGRVITLPRQDWMIGRQRAEVAAEEAPPQARTDSANGLGALARVSPGIESALAMTSPPSSTKSLIFASSSGVSSSGLTPSR